MSSENEILAVSADWDAALVSNDADAVAAFMADEWVYVEASGPTPKADIIEWIRTGRLAHHTMEAVSPPRLGVHGETAVLTARKASSGTWEGTPYTADEWITDVYVRRAGRWQCVLSHKTGAT